MTEGRHLKGRAGQTGRAGRMDHSDEADRSSEIVGVWEVADEAAMIELGESVGRALAGSSTVLLLVGDLGSGKTTFTKGVARALGIDAAEVLSPTYTLIHEYVGRSGATLLHVDLYRLDPEEVPATGLEEELGRAGIKVVEWAERLPWEEPGALRIEFELLAGGGRRLSARRAAEAATGGEEG